MLFSGGNLGEGSKAVIPGDKQMLKVGDTMAGFLDTQSAANQIEAIYIAYFARAAEEPGLNYWSNTYSAQIAAGNSVDTAANNIANTFALQTEAKNLYGFLASPPTHVNPTDPVQIAAATAMVEAVYLNLFNRTVTSTDVGVQYWVGQILNGQVGVGTAIYAIANGALGADQTVLTAKIAAGTDFTTVTYAANLGTIEPVSAGFLTAAKNSVAPVFDATSLAASIVASAAYAAGTNGTINATLTTGADNVTANNIFGSLTTFFVNGIGPTLNSTDVITGLTPPVGQTANNSLILADDNAAGTDAIPIGTTINNIQNSTLNTAGNAGGAGPIYDTSAYSSVVNTIVNSSGGGFDFVRAGSASTITVTHQNTAGGVQTFGGTAVTVSSQGTGTVTVGSTGVAGANPTGAVVITTSSVGAVTVIGGSTVNVTDNGVTGTVTVGAAGSSVAAPSEPSGAVTINEPTGNLTGIGIATTVNGGVGVTINDNGGVVKIGTLPAGSTTLFTPTGNFTVTDTAAVPFETSYVGPALLNGTGAPPVGPGISSGPTPGGFAAAVTTLGGANVTVTTNTGGVTVGGKTVNGNSFLPGQNPTGAVSVTDTSNLVAVNVFGGTTVNVAASGDAVTIGAANNATQVEGPSGAVTVTNTAPVTYDGLINNTSQSVTDIGGTTVSVTTNAGGVTIGNPTGLPNSEPTGAITVTDTALNGAVNAAIIGGAAGLAAAGIQIFGGTSVSVTASGQPVVVGSPTIAAVDPTGAVTVAQSAVESGGQFGSSIQVNGGAAVTITTTGSGGTVGASAGVQVGQNTSPVTGAVSITDTFVGPNLDTFNVVGGTTVSITTTALTAAGSINVGNQTAPVALNAAGTALANPASFSSGNVTIVDESLAGTSSAGATNVFGKGAISVLTNGATAVSISGGSAVTITDVQTTLATGGPGANSAIGPSTLATVSLDGVSGAATITSDAIATLTIADSSKAASTAVTILEPAAATVSKALALTLNNAALKGTTSVTDAVATSVTVSTAGTAADEFALNAAKATSVTFNNAVAVTLDASVLGNVTAITATGAGALSLGDFSGDANLASITGAGSSGTISVTLNDVNGSFTGGSGSDTVTITTNPGQDLNPPPTIAAGSATTNTIVANYAAAAGDTALGSTATIHGFTTLGLGAKATSAIAAYDASGFSGLTLGAITGPVALTNVAPSTTLTLTAAPGVGNLVDLFLKDAKGTNDTLSVTQGVDGSTGTKGFAASVVLSDSGVGNGYHNLSVASVGQGGTATNTLSVTDTEAATGGPGASVTIISVTGDTALTLSYASTVVGGSNVTSILDSSSATVDVTGVALSTGGVTIASGAGLLKATGVGAVNASTAAIDSYTTGTGGATITLGYGGAWKGAQLAPPASGYDKGSETVNLTGSPATADTLNVSAGVTANNTSPGIGGVTGFASVVGSTADVLSYFAAHTVLANVGTPLNISGAAGTIPGNYAADIIQVDAGVTAGATATAVSEMTYKSSNGIITFGANGSNNVSQFTAQQLITAAEAIVLKAAETTLKETIAAFSVGGNTYIVASDGGGADVDADHLYGASVVELVGTTGITGFGATGASTVIDTKGVSEVSALNKGAATASPPWNDAGFSEDNLALATTGAGITNTYTNLGAAAQLDVGGAANDQGTLVVTQSGTSGSQSLIVNFVAAATLEGLTTSGDGTLLIQVGGNTDVITGITDATNTTTVISATGGVGSSLTIGAGGITDSALVKFDAHTDLGSLTLTVAQSGLTILGAQGGDTITANSASDVITVGSATTALNGPVAITANGTGDTISLVHSTTSVGTTTNTIGAASAGDTFTVDGGTNTIAGTIALGAGTHALGSGDTINLLSGAGSDAAGVAATDTVWAGGGATKVVLGTSTAAFGAGAVVDSATVNVSHDLTGALSGGSPAMVQISGAASMGANGSLVIDFHNSNANGAALGTETWAGLSALNAQVNVASATSLAAAFDLAASQSSTIDAQFHVAGGTAPNTQVVNGALSQNGNTGLITWFQFGGNTYLVDAINANPTNTSSTAVAHTALAATDELVQLTGLVDLSNPASHVSIVSV